MFILAVKSDEQGDIVEVKISKSPHDLLSKAAIEAVKQWKYEPMIIKGKPMPIIFTVWMNFSLK